MAVPGRGLHSIAARKVAEPTPTACKMVLAGVGTLWPVDGAGSVDGANGRAAHRPLENRRADAGFPRPPTGRASWAYSRYGNGRPTPL